MELTEIGTMDVPAHGVTVGNVTYYESWCIVSSDISLDEVSEHVQKWMRAGNRMQWYIGSLLLQAHDRFGELAAQVVNLTGWSYPYLRQVMDTAKQFPPESQKKVSFTHHFTARRWKDSDEMLLLAETQGLTVEEMVNEHRGPSLKLKDRSPIIQIVNRSNHTIRLDGLPPLFPGASTSKRCKTVTILDVEE